MKKLNHPLKRFLDRAQGRFVRSRPGSVLILVVALLVLMALIGTAYMTMAQFDRATAVQHSFNTEVDLLLDGVVNLVKGTVTSDVFVQSQFRPGSPTYNSVPPTSPGTYSYANGLGLDVGSATSLGAANKVPYAANPGNTWLGSRIPEVSNAPTAATAGTIIWPFLSAALNGSGQFDSPYWTSSTSPVRYILRTRVTPWSITLPSLTAPQPAFTNIPGFGTVLAADTDGDGVADAGLFKLPVGTVDGITYYGAVRIIDNCAAINASIATRPNPVASFVATQQMPGDFFPVNLDLEGMLISPAAELYGAGLLGYRFQGAMPSAGGIDDNGAIRPDFGYMTYPDPLTPTRLYWFDQQWMQLGRRLDNPGYVAATFKYQALPLGDSLTLANHFILYDPTLASPASSSAAIERLLPSTMFASGRSLAYAPNDTVNWYNQNFNYNYVGGVNNNNMPMRALFVTRNPVSGFAPNKFAVTAGAAQFGSLFTANNHAYVCINPGTVTPPLSPTADPTFTDPNWAYEPWSTSPTKTSVNTATFQQLYAAYWAVMADQVSASGWLPAFVSPGRMFRNPTRIGSTATLNPQQVMYLRAALAAVNTMDLRDGDNDITSRTIFLPDATGKPQYQAIVYGGERNPYITQVYARNDPTQSNDFVAIEIYNPLPAAAVPTQNISLLNWQFATLKRAGMTLTTLAPITTPATIAPGQRIIFVSANPPPPTVKLPSPLPANSTIVVLPGLANGAAFGNELVLLRPRRADGTITTGITPSPPVPPSINNNTFAESKPAEMVPVDSYDFTNLAVLAAPPAVPQEWRYVRPSSKPWHFVYPGVWNNAAIAPAPTLKGTMAAPAPALTDLSTVLGVAQTAPLVAAPAYQDVPLQIANLEFGGPLKVTTATNNYFPYGGFARDGDILQVPFIGSYSIFIDSNGTRGALAEMNAVTMDSAMATALDVGDTNPGTPIANAAVTAENIGRFCPIDPTDASTAGSPTVNDFGTTPANWRYHWATRLFDYLTTMAPQDDYLPNVDPWRADPTSLPSPGPYRYAPSNTNALQIPNAVANAVTATAANKGNSYYPNGTAIPTFNANNTTEETVPVNGLVNINTAPWRVLAAVPWYPATAANYSTANATVAQAIVKYRDVDDSSVGANPKHGHGPFHSIFELNAVPVVGTTKLRDILGPTSTTDFNLAQGNLSPINAGSDGVVGDFESRFNTMTRVSNLITTRSDSYTAYILVQGWRNAETNNPQLVVQRRAAIIIDRSAVTSSNPNPTVINVPVD